MNRTSAVRRTRVDVKLLRVLKTAEGNDDLIEVACRIRLTRLSPREIEGLMQELIDRAAKNAGTPPERMRTFPKIGTSFVTAASRFIALLIYEPEIVSAAMIRQRS